MKRLCALLSCVLTAAFVIGCSESTRPSVSPSAVPMASASMGALDSTTVAGDKFTLMGANKLSLNNDPVGALRVGDTVNFTASGNWASLRLQCFAASRTVFEQTNTPPNTSFVLSSDVSYGEKQICDASLFSPQGKLMGEVQFLAEF